MVLVAVVSHALLLGLDLLVGGVGLLLELAELLLLEVADVLTLLSLLALTVWLA